MSSRDEADDEQPRPVEDDEGSVGEADELPGWLQKLTDTARELPGGARRVAVWVPTIVAGWRAAERGLALASGLRRRLDDEDPPDWPEELVEEFVETVDELGEALPELDEALPAAAEIVELAEEGIGPEKSIDALDRALEKAETVGEAALHRLVELAFFETSRERRAVRNRHLRRLFNRLESLFDRLVIHWIEDSHKSGTKP